MWSHVDDTDPITLEKHLAVVAEIQAQLSPVPAIFEVTATCDKRGFYFKTVYLSPGYQNPGFLHAGPGVILAFRMRIDDQVRDAHSAPLNFNNIATFTFGTDFSVAIPSGTAEELYRATNIKIEMPLNNGPLPILEIHPQDPEFHNFATTCGTAFPALRLVRPPTQATTNRPKYTPPPPLEDRVAEALKTLPPDSSLLVIRSNFTGPLKILNPLTNMSLYLMRDDFATTLKKAGVRVPANAEPKETFLKVCSKPNHRKECDALFDASKSKPAAKVLADGHGEAIFPPVPKGEYYVLIYSYAPGRPKLYWNEKVVLAPGENTFAVSMDNAKPLQ